MPNYKAVFTYSQPIDKTWSEVYYISAASLQLAATMPQALLVAFAYLRHELTTLVKLRVSDVANNRTSVVVPLNVGGLNAATGPDIAGASAIITLASSVTGSSRKLWLRGLGDGDVERDPTTGADKPTFHLTSGITNLLQLMVASSFQIRSLVQIGSPPNVYSTISSISGTVGMGQATINYLGNATFVAGNRIVLSQLDPKLYPGLNGHFTVLSAAANQVTIPYNLDGTPPAGVKKGRLRTENYQYGIINPSISGFTKFNTRITGGGSLGGRGRRRAQHLRSL